MEIENIRKERAQEIAKRKKAVPLRRDTKGIFVGNKKEGVLYTRIIKRNGEILHFNGEPPKERRSK